MSHAPHGSWAAWVRDDFGTHLSESIVEEDRLTLVSRLYGPGVVVAWYLTTLSVAISWLLHPRKRQADSLDTALAACLLLPSVATVDFILRARAILNMSDEQKALKRTSLARWQPVSAMQAPFDVLEIFMLPGAVLFFIAISHYCCRRASAVAVTTLLCFAGACHLHFSGVRALVGRRWFRDRWEIGSFRPDPYAIPIYGSTVGIFIATLPVLFAILVGISVFLVRRYKTLPVDIKEDIEEHEHAVYVKRLSKGLLASVKRHFSILSGLLVLLLSMAMSIGPPIERLVTTSYGVPPWTIWQIIEKSVPNLMVNWFPASSYSINDRDQAVIATAGAAVLSFTICSVGKAYYDVWKESRNRISGVDGDVKLKDSLQQ